MILFIVLPEVSTDDLGRLLLGYWPRFRVLSRGGSTAAFTGSSSPV
jgi:hypothetical protein